MFQSVIESIKSFGSFTDEELSFFKGKLSELKVRKKEFVLKEGKVCRAFYFLMKGSCIHRLAVGDGTETIINLYVSDVWLTDYRSFTSQKPAITSIQAFKDCHLAVLDIQSLHELILESPVFFKAGRLMQTLEYTDIETFNQTPEEKYRHLLAHRPELIKTFPLKLLASYLRITPETLSRIRKRIL